MRRTWLRGRENVHKRYLVHVAGHNLGILMRLLVGAGTPREAVARGLVYLFIVYAGEAVAIFLVVLTRRLCHPARSCYRRPWLIKERLQQRAVGGDQKGTGEAKSQSLANRDGLARPSV
jgi:hypothetical protein